MIKRKKQITTRQINNLVKKALKNGFKAKPPKGYKYLEDLKPGSGFETASGMAGILLECEGNARVIIGKAPNIAPEDRATYLGRKIIAGKTEVKEIKWRTIR